MFLTRMGPSNDLDLKFPPKATFKSKTQTRVDQHSKWTRTKRESPDQTIFFCWNPDQTRKIQPGPEGTTRTWKKTKRTQTGPDWPRPDHLWNKDFGICFLVFDFKRYLQGVPASDPALSLPRTTNFAACVDIAKCVYFPNHSALFDCKVHLFCYPVFCLTGLNLVRPLKQKTSDPRGALDCPISNQINWRISI